MADGLAYLHSDSLRLIHHDLSASNVLLISDDTSSRGFRALLSDFGLTTMLGLDVSHKTSDLKGTLAYMPPEAFEHGHVSTELDIYSFGALSE